MMNSILIFSQSCIEPEIFYFFLGLGYTLFFGHIYTKRLIDHLWGLNSKKKKEEYLSSSFGRAC